MTNLHLYKNDKPISLQKFTNLHLYKNDKPTSLQKWHQKRGKELDDQVWENEYSVPFKITDHTKLQSFQFKISH